jgi:hypothetical protein
MMRTGEEDEVPLRFDDENNMNNHQEDDKSRAFGGPSLEDLMRRLEKLTVENNKLRRKAKGKKTKGGPSSSEDEDSSLEEDVSKKGKKGETIMISLPITQCLSIMTICLSLPLTLPYPLAKLPTLIKLVIINGSIA